ncbi:hypothetical protein DFH28DRAFT_1192064 [Melampsora americana]|nr:hypothetical protein DFH28DRAFT_1192064 [Melampsora americana]
MDEITSQHHITDPYIENRSNDPADPEYRCTACVSRSMRDYRAHICTAAHHRSVQKLLDRQAQDEAMLQAIRSTRKQSSQGTPPENLETNPFDQPELPVPNSPERPFTPLSFLHDLHGTGIADDSSGSDDSDHILDFQLLRQGLEALANLNLEHLPNEIDDEDGMDIDIELDNVAGLETNGWYPFRKKEVPTVLWLHFHVYQIIALIIFLSKHLVALLIIGSTRSLLSRLQYQRIRSILRICKVELPEWRSLRELTNRLKHQLGLGISARELANPIVSPQLEFMPELPVNTPTNRLSHSKKWRELYPPHLRVQMVVSKNVHFYIYEPVQVVTGQLVVPLFFYKHAKNLMAKCIPAVVESASQDSSMFNIFIEPEPPFDSPALLSINISSFWRLLDDVKLENGVRLRDSCGNHIYMHTPRGVEDLPLINPWRIKAQGMPPDWSNQEFNTHFLATTNTASALELFDQVVDEINELGRNGFVTYDHLLGDDVCAMVVVLAHLGDAPMHAEICNTTNPANTLSPCRICELKVDRQMDKQTEGFVRHFLGIDNDGFKYEVPHRDWNLTRERTHEVWRTAQNPHSKTLVEDLFRTYGVRDGLLDFFIQQVQSGFDKLPLEQSVRLCERLNEEWGDRLFNPMLRLEGFNGHLDTPVEILHVILLGVVKYLFRDTMKAINPGKSGAKKFNSLSARWQSFNCKGLKVPPIQPNTLIQFFQSLVGKEFRTVLQTVPFVIYQHVTEEVRHLWTALCIMASYVFQTEIGDVDNYLIELDAHVDIFLNRLVSMSGQWANKPKFHMLTHLKYSIQRFGPPCLVATEKFEAFNGKTRDASVHSNKQSPGNDIANTFLTALMMRIFLSGTSFFDHKLQARVVAGPEVLSLLTTVPELAQAMGLNMNVGDIGLYADDGRKDLQGDIPQCLQQTATTVSLEEVVSVTLPSRQKVEKEDFVAVNQEGIIGQVVSIWKPVGHSSGKIILALARCKKGRVVPFYGMREFVPTEHVFACDIKKVECLVNMQHNCHDGNCTEIFTRTKKIERRETTIPIPTIEHQAYKSYILNSASHYSAELHRKLADLHVDEVTPDEWNHSIRKGLTKWKSAPRAARAKKGA